jgi:thymidylate synthase ThyX
VGKLDNELTFRRIEDIEVKLVGAIDSPYETAVATARTCYSGKGIIYPEDVSKDERSVAMRDRIAHSTLQAGHLTTRQHAHFVFAITGVSRQCLWSFLHSHPFYNSEQVSQRYVRVKRGNFLMPPLPPAAEKIYGETVDAQMSDYERLIELLRVPIEADYYDRFKSRRKEPERWKGVVDKRSFEVARYALGVGTTAYLYHTVSALTLMRYAKLCNAFETPAEQRVLVQKMLDKVREIDPLFEKELTDPMPIEKTLEYRLLSEKATRPSSAFLRDFDDRLDGKFSKLVSHTTDPETTLADAFRTMLGKAPSELSDEAALAQILDPKNNRVLADTINLTPLDRLSQVMRHVQFTFHKKISHTADSQDQRHRLVPASRPILHFHFTGEPDYITPYGITQSAEAQAVYERSMERSWKAVSQLLDMGVEEQYAFYLLPNAVSVRMVSTGDLQALWHKWKLRACYNAQEEIFRATTQEVEQVQAKFPRLGSHLRAPCYVRMRAGITPYCPEGDKYCGLPVWKYDITQYDRKSL